MKNNLALKKELYTKCLEFAETRWLMVNTAMNEIQKSLLSETKSSAGDKHETGRAMLQIEREKTGNQLAEIQKTKEILKKINVSKTSNIVSLGSVVFTSKSNYFIAISAGNILIDNQEFYAIAIDTPIGQLLKSKQIRDEVVFRDEKIKIEKVF